MNVFKLYLSRMLCQRYQGSSTVIVRSSPLLPLHLPTRTEIANVLSTSSDLGSPGPYIPNFYRSDSSIILGSTESDDTNVSFILPCMECSIDVIYVVTNIIMYSV